MSALSSLNPGADHTAQAHALAINVSAGKGLSEVLKSNLGPRGTLKMLVDGAGAVKLTKDGSVLLHQMQIQHPTAIMIARTATAQDDETGDGTTSAVLFTGELLKYAERVISDGVHPRTVADGLDMAKDATLAFLDSYKTPVSGEDKELLLSVAKTALRTKLQPDMADQLADIVTEAVLTVQRPGQPIDLHMVERMHMVHRSDKDSRLVKGLVLDHGARDPNMPKLLENAYILTCNISLEYEKSEVTATQVFSTAAERDRLADAERAFVDEKVRRIIDLKRSVCTPENGRTFVVVNQKGIDPPSLDMLAKEGIIGIRRAKRRNMERLTLACGGVAVNAVEELDASVLGSAGRVYEQTLGDDKYTFVEGVENPFSCTILMKGPNAHTIAQLKDAVRDGLRAVRNTIEDGAVVAGAGAFEVAAAEHLQAFAKKEVSGKAKLGVQAFADALLIVPKTLAENSGFDVAECLLAVQEEAARMATAGPSATGGAAEGAAGAGSTAVGLDVWSGKPMQPAAAGVWDNLRVKKQYVHLAAVLASQLLMVDEVMRAGRGSRSG